MAIEGSLADVGLADICQLISMGRKTGCLTVTDRSNFGYVYFEKGRVVYASVLNRPDRLGELLVRNEVVTREQLSRAMEKQAHRPGERLGRLLVDDGSLREEDLRRYITVQIEEAVYYLFTWNQGTFHFDADQRPEEEGLMLVSINLETLLLEGARRVDEWELIAKKIPSMDLVFTLERDPEADADVELTQHQRRVLHLLDGRRSIAEIIDESGLVEFDGAKALYGLLQAGYVQRSGRRAAPRDTGDTKVQQHLNLGTAFYRAGMLEDAERELGRVVDVEPRHPQARFRLGLIQLKAGEPARALDHFEAMPPEAREAYGVLRNRALALEQLGRYGESLELLGRAEEVRPDDPEAILARGIAQLRAGDAEAARNSFARYRGRVNDARPAPIYYAYAVLAAAADGRMDAAVAISREGLTHYPSEGPLLVNAGSVLEVAGKYEAADALFIRAVSQSPPPAQAHKNLGDMAYRRGDQTGARAHFERAIKLDPRLGDDVYLKLGTIAYKEDDPDWAGLLWRRALELNPRNTVVRSNLEMLTAASGR